MSFINWGEETPEQKAARRYFEEQQALFEQAVRFSRTTGAMAGVGSGTVTLPKIAYFTKQERGLSYDKEMWISFMTTTGYVKNLMDGTVFGPLSNNIYDFWNNANRCHAYSDTFDFEFASCDVDGNETGSITHIDANSQLLVKYDVNGLTDLQYLDIGFTEIEQPTLDGARKCKNLFGLFASEWTGNTFDFNDDFKQLKEIGTYNSDNLISIDFSKLTEIEGIFINHCDSLQSIILDAPSKAKYLYLDSNSQITSQTIDHILIELDRGGSVNGELACDLGRRTSASDSARNSLLDKGWSLQDSN